MAIHAAISDFPIVLTIINYQMKRILEKASPLWSVFIAWFDENCIVEGIPSVSTQIFSREC